MGEIMKKIFLVLLTCSTFNLSARLETGWKEREPEYKEIGLTLSQLCALIREEDNQENFIKRKEPKTNLRGCDLCFINGSEQNKHKTFKLPCCKNGLCEGCLKHMFTKSYREEVVLRNENSGKGEQNRKIFNSQLAPADQTRYDILNSYEVSKQLPVDNKFKIVKIDNKVYVMENTVCYRYENCEKGIKIISFFGGSCPFCKKAFPLNWHGNPITSVTGATNVTKGTNATYVANATGVANAAGVNKNLSEN